MQCRISFSHPVGYTCRCSFIHFADNSYQRRFQSRHLSPDRSYQEIIADRQNSFKWEERHLFRPHQHFTFDPSSWSRELSNKYLKKPVPTLLRLLSEDEQKQMKQEEHSNEDLTCSTHPSVENSSTPRESADARSASRVHSLQERVNRVEELHERLSSPRYKKYLTRNKVSRLSREMEECVVNLFDQVQCQYNHKPEGRQTSLSFTSTICIWLLLVEHAEVLVTGLLRRRVEISAMEATMMLEGNEEVNSSISTLREVKEVFSALKSSIFDRFLPAASMPAPSGDVDLSTMAAESWVEVLGVIYSPFVEKCAQLFNTDSTINELYRSSDLVDNLFSQAVLVLDERLNSVSTRRRKASGSLDKREEAISMALLQVWGSTVKRMFEKKRFLSPMLATRSFNQLCSLVNASALNLMFLLRASILGSKDCDAGALPTQSLRDKLELQKLAGKSNIEIGFSKTDHNASADCCVRPFVPSHHQQVPSRGIARPLTQPEDAACFISALTSVIQIYDCVEVYVFRDSQKTGMSCRDAASHVWTCLNKALEFLSFCPNYDLDVPGISILCTLALQRLPDISSRREVEVTEPQTSYMMCLHSLLLLLSRCDVGSKTAPSALCSLCHALVASRTSGSESIFGDMKLLDNDCRRLKGQTLGNIFSALHANDLYEYDNANNVAVPWEIRFNDARTRVGFSLWRESLQCRGLWPQYSSGAGHQSGSSSFIALRDVEQRRELCASLLGLGARCKELYSGTQPSEIAAEAILMCASGLVYAECRDDDVEVWAAAKALVQSDALIVSLIEKAEAVMNRKNKAMQKTMCF